MSVCPSTAVAFSMMESFYLYQQCPDYTWMTPQPHLFYNHQPSYRSRCNTWPRNIMERSQSCNSALERVSESLENSTECVTESVTGKVTETVTETVMGNVTENVKESLTEDTLLDADSRMDDIPYGRRNPWGPYSYAQLITLAISSTSEKKMTLHQIYEFLISKFSYFAERKSNEKSAGWKNSIRHNLSLHQKFQKVRNDGIGRSSWWVLNPDCDQGRQGQRRRATAGDVRSLQSRRDLVRSRLDRRRWYVQGVVSPIDIIFRKSCEEGKLKGSEAKRGCFADDLELDQFDILRFMESGESYAQPGLDLCLDSLILEQPPDIQDYFPHNNSVSLVM